LWVVPCPLTPGTSPGERGTRARPETPFGVRQTRLIGEGFSPGFPTVESGREQFRQGGGNRAKFECGTVGYVSQSQLPIATLARSRAI